MHQQFGTLLAVLGDSNCYKIGQFGYMKAGL